MSRTFTIALALVLLAPLMACAKAPEDLSPRDARRELEKWEVKYSPEEFLNRANMGDTNAVKLFLVTGMDPDTRDNRGMTALMMAAREGHDPDHTEIVKALLKKGADVNAKNEDGKTALMYASEGGHLTIEQLLKEAGAGK